MVDTNTIIRNINNYLTIKTSKSKRRKVVTLTNIKKGTLLLKEKAIASVINSNLIDSCCNYCYKKKSINTSLYRCSGCHSSYYCSKNCQKKAYKYHKSECKFIKQYPVSATSTMRFLNLILLKVKENSEIKKYFDELIDYYDKFIENSDENTIDKYRKLALGGKFFSGYEGSIESLMKIMNKISCNSLGINNENAIYYASGLFLQASNINHDCNPNCSFYFEGDTIYIKAVKDLTKDEEITLCYTQEYNSVRIRQEYLKNFYFTCQCSRCSKYKDQYYLDPMEGVKCQTKGCDGYISHVEFNPCPKCHQKLPSKIINKVKDILNNFYNLPEKIDVIIPKNIEGKDQIKWLENLLEEQKKLFHPHNYIKFATLNKLNDVILYNLLLQNNELLLSKNTLINYEIYRYCQNFNLNPSFYRISTIYYVLTSVVNEILNYQLGHNKNEILTYTKKKLDSIQFSVIYQQLETEMALIFESDSTVYKNIQLLLKNINY